jgi:predicted SprT family Zn-dependent metalloprotease
MRPPHPPDPTTEQFDQLQRLFAFFNRAFWSGTLPPVLFNFSRGTTSYGFYAPSRWHNGEETTPEISLTPRSLCRPPIDTCQTLCHEMVHHWQHTFGKTSRQGHHNRQFRAEMARIGLISDGAGHTSRVEDGPFDLACKKLAEEQRLPWTPTEPSPKERSRNKVKYRCSTCSRNAWGAPGLVLLCRTNHEPQSMKEVG